MSWNVTSVMQSRREFANLASQPQADICQICHRFGISRKTAYKWLQRYRAGAPDWAADRSRRPHHSPNRTPKDREARVVSVRNDHAAWGGRKIRQVLINQGEAKAPAPSTITSILHRYNKIDPEESAKRQAYVRFERKAPNELWQMDFKGDFAMMNGRCHTLAVLDDHSRYALCLAACADQREATVREWLTRTFRLYGLPQCMLMDNGSCWGMTEQARHTHLTAWLIRLGVSISHGRPYHPQTQGKLERFNRTFQAEVVAHCIIQDLTDGQKRYDRWRSVYNCERPHEALAMATPASRYHTSSIAFPECLPAIEYGASDVIRKVSGRGTISYAGQILYVGKPFEGLPVALRPTLEDGIWHVFFCHQKILQINLKQNNS